jgi:hypothetical protein
MVANRDFERDRILVGVISTMVFMLSTNAFTRRAAPHNRTHTIQSRIF